MVTKLFGIEDEVICFEEVVQSHADSPLRKVRGGMASDPALNLDGLFT